MKILILNGSARKKGNTRTALKQIEKGIDLNNNSAEFIDITDFKIAGCLGCDGCKRTGVCVIKDDAVGLVEKGNSKCFCKWNRGCRFTPVDY